MDHKFTSGSILTQTFSIFFSNIVAFGTIVVVILSPSLIFQVWFGFESLENPGEFPWQFFVLLLLGLLLTPVATGALTYGVFQSVRGKQASVSDCLSVGFKRLFPVLGVGILSGLITMFGMILCIVPGIIAATILAAALPAAVIERPGVLGALTRSSDLTKDYRWTVFGVVFGLGILQMVAGFAVNLTVAISVHLSLGLNVVTSILFTGLQATAPALIYYHLRKAKESIDVEDIAAVFD